MKKLIFLLFILLGCEKNIPISELQTSYLELSSELSYNGDIYTFNYPTNSSNSYFKVDFLSLPQERVFWSTPDMFYVVLDIYNDTIWDEVINCSSYANEEGIGHQLVYVNQQLLGDTLNIIGTIHVLGEEIKEILIKVEYND